MDDKIVKVLIDRALQARERAITTFSGFKVGAGLLCCGGNIYTGCNIENPSIGLSICAERVALLKAISEGEKVFEMLAIVADTKFLTYPCGICRQMIWEFGPLTKIILTNLKGMIKTSTINDLLPNAFDFSLIQDELAKNKIQGKK